MVLIGVYPAGLVGLDLETREGEDVVSRVAQGPIGQLDRLRIDVLDLDVLIRLGTAGAVVEDMGDIDIACIDRCLFGGSWGIRGSVGRCICWCIGGCGRILWRDLRIGWGVHVCRRGGGRRRRRGAKDQRQE